MDAAQSLLPEDYLPHLDALNRIVIESGVPAEGNLFYFHREPHPGRQSVYGEFYPKRRNFVAACRAGTTLLEIGMNAGHSALLALACGVEYHGVDIASHPYVRPAADYLAAQFGGRFHFHEGDSLVKLPEMAQQFPFLRFDLIHIDGHHGAYYVERDFTHAMAMALQGAWVMIDDTDLPEIRAFHDQLLATGALLAEAPPGWEEFRRHAIGRAP